MEFERLIEAETRNDELLQRARRDAVVLRREAVERAAAGEAALAEELAALLRASAERLTLRREEQLRAVAEETRARVARLAAVTDPEVADAARAVLASLLEPGGRR